MSETLYTTQTPALTDVSEGQNTTVATTVVFAAAGNVKGGRFYAPATVSGTFAIALWQITADDNPADTGTGTLLASATAGTVTAGAWNTVTFSSPVAVDTSHAYRIGLRTSAGRYTATGNFFGSALTNGNITAPADQASVAIGTVANGTFIDASVTAYPIHTFNKNGYFVDPVFDVASAAPAVTVWNGTSEVAVGGVTVWNGTSEVTASVASIAP